MKLLITACAMMALNFCSGQAFTLPEPENNIPVGKEYTHILVYKRINGGWFNSNGLAGTRREWVLAAEGFYSLEDLMKRLNSNTSNLYSSFGYRESPDVTIEQKNIVAIYDLKNASKLKLKLITEEKSKPHRVEIQEEKWTERHYELDKSKQ